MTTAKYCYGLVCFVPLDSSSPRIFGFSEFLTGLALMVLAWTIADVRYLFRIRIAPLPLLGITFGVVASVGLLTLLTDLWCAEGWLVPEGSLITPALWQALLGGILFVTFFTWMWFAFIRPPKYGRNNAIRFSQTLYLAIVRGASAELAVIADELRHSVKSLIRYAPDIENIKNEELIKNTKNKTTFANVEAYANDLLLLVADKRFCRAIIETSPSTALAIFQEISETKKYGINIKTFAKNIMNEALSNKDSFLFHETEGYESGLIGCHKPVSHAMFSSYEMVESMRILLEPDILVQMKCDATQNEAYCRVVLMTLQDYIAKGCKQHSFVLWHAFENIENSVFSIYRLNGVDKMGTDCDLMSSLRVVVNFIKSAIKLLDEKDLSRKQRSRKCKNSYQIADSLCDRMAEMIYKVIAYSSRLVAPRRQCWWVHYNLIWARLFGLNNLNSPTGKVVKFKVRRLLYDEIVKLKECPNFTGAGILGFCLNVFGLSISNSEYSKDGKPLHKAVLSWARKNYVWLHNEYKGIAEACLVEGMTYDAANHRLVKTYPENGLRQEPSHDYFDLEVIMKEEHTIV
ncbi:hypothetical protein [Desulfolutivibrio sulfoxidireducens]|uniref:hypothetical protein n=1 Tax=Desulfolutivibrio sulfoxidireducens TaxID=2773299 RepID=UPI00159D94FB|nr:hypothetical protein [Desulfolutivibrio sulfoxidireducens]